MPIITDGCEDVAATGKPNQEQIGAAEVKVNAANAALKPPTNLQQAGSTEYYEVQVITLHLSSLAV